MKYIGAAFFDYDGTLSDEELGIYYPTEKTVKAICDLKSRGFFVCLATGRAKCYAPRCGIDFDGYVTSNGAYAEIGEKAVLNRVFPDELYCEAAEFFKSRNIYYSVENQKCCYALDKNNKKFKGMIENFNIPSEIFYPIEEMGGSKVYKMLAPYNDEEDFEAMTKHFAGRLTFDKHRFYPSVDVGICGTTKANGVLAVCKALGIKKEDTYAFGDGTNDIEMLKAAGHPVAMEISPYSVKAAAEFVTASVADEGIYKALLNYGLIDKNI